MRARFVIVLVAVAIALCSCSSPSEASSEYSVGPLAKDRAYGTRLKSLDLFAAGENLYANVSVGLYERVFYFMNRSEVDESRDGRSFLYAARDNLLADLHAAEETDENEFRPFLTARYSEEFFVDYVLAVTQNGTSSIYPEEYEIIGNQINLHLQRSGSAGWFIPASGFVFYPIPKTRLNLNVEYELTQVVHYFK